MKINIDMEAWELATVIKGLTISAPPEEKKPSDAEQIKPILSDKTREELRKALTNAFKVPEKVTTLPQKTESEKTGYMSSDKLDALVDSLRQKHKTNEIFGESKHREENPNPNYRPPMGGENR